MMRKFFLRIKNHIAKPISAFEYYSNIIIIGIIAIGVVLYNINFFESNENKKVDRPIFSVKKDEVYNVIKLANPESNSLINIYSYLPHSEQLLENIPSCIEPTKKQAINYINAYDKIFMYLSNSKDYKDSSSEQIGIITKAVLDYDYNYYNYEYLRCLLSLKIKDSDNVSMQEVFNQVTTSIYHNKESLPAILNKVLTKSEQEILAKEIYQLYKQSRDNCIQAGAGNDFYSVFWSGMPEQYSYENSSYIMQKIVISAIDSAIMKNRIQFYKYNKSFELLNYISSENLSKYSDYIVAKQLSLFENYIGGKIKLYGDLGYILEIENQLSMSLRKDLLSSLQEDNIFYASFNVTKNYKQNKSMKKLENNCKELKLHENTVDLLCKNKNLMCYVVNNAEYMCDIKKTKKEIIARMKDFNKFYK